MATRSISQVVRHAVLLQVSLTSPAFIACGGAVDGGVHVAGSNRDVEAGGGEGGVEAGEPGGGAEAAVTCAVVSPPTYPRPAA